MAYNIQSQLQDDALMSHEIMENLTSDFCFISPLDVVAQTVLFLCGGSENFLCYGEQIPREHTSYQNQTRDIQVIQGRSS